VDPGCAESMRTPAPAWRIGRARTAAGPSGRRRARGHARVDNHVQAAPPSAIRQMPASAQAPETCENASQPASVLPDDQRFGVMPKGRVLVGPGGPAGRFYVQLIEFEPGIVDAAGKEWIARIGLGTPDPRACVAALRERGMAFAESAHTHAHERGALTRMQLGSVVFELVRDAQLQGT